MSDDLVRRLAFPYPKDEDVDEVTLPLWVLELTTEAADRIEELEAAIKRQAGAARTLRQLTLAEVQHLSDMDRSEYFAAQTLNSERDANAILTERIEELEVELSNVKLELNGAVKLLTAAGDGLRLMVRVEMAEAKLAVAVEALEDVNTFGDFGLQHVVRPALAKIKGDKP